MPDTAPAPASPAPAAKAVPESNGFVTRDQWLNQSAHLREKEVEIEDFGKLLLTEITGAVRAKIQSQQSRGLLSDVKSVDAAAYQRELILNGVVDPTSPEGARRPMFAAGDMDKVMSIGGSKIAQIVEALEELSGLGVFGARAEENSEETPSAAGTS